MCRVVAREGGLISRTVVRAERNTDRRYHTTGGSMAALQLLVLGGLASIAVGIVQLARGDAMADLGRTLALHFVSSAYRLSRDKSQR